MHVPDKYLLVLTIIGIADAVYLTGVHYFSVTLACPETGFINCQKVLSSQYASIIGIPVAVLGLVFFIGELVLLFKFKQKDLRLLYNGAGMGFVFYFLFAEYSLGAICIYCTLVHIVVTLLFVSCLINFREK